jgi:hypothetical protein
VGQSDRVGAPPPRLEVKRTFHNPGPTRFTEFLIRENDRVKDGFDCWIFHPGMLFHSPDKWWGDRGKRSTPHEGLDLCLYRDTGGRIHCLDDKTRIPVLHDGVIVAIVNDFLGKSVIVEHQDQEGAGLGFCSIYGHTNPPDDLQIGNSVKRGAILATLADSSRSKSGIQPHLHISLGLTDKFISYAQFDWGTIGSWDMLTLLDPLIMLDRPYQVVQF